MNSEHDRKLRSRTIRRSVGACSSTNPSAPASRAEESCSIAIENSVDEQPIVRRRAADMALRPRKNILDPIPFIIPQSIPIHWSPLKKPTTHGSLRQTLVQRFQGSNHMKPLCRACRTSLDLWWLVHLGMMRCLQFHGIDELIIARPSKALSHGIRDTAEVPASRRDLPVMGRLADEWLLVTS
jgi:hypothetical protein